MAPDTTNGHELTPNKTGFWTGAAAENAALFHKRVVEARGLSQSWVRMELRSWIVSSLWHDGIWQDGVMM